MLPGPVSETRIDQFNAASKYALRGIADGIRDTFNSDGVRVLSVCLGGVATLMQAGLQDYLGNPYHADRLMQPGDVAESIVSALQLPKTAEVTDIHLGPMLK